jgi:hypothetical protein
VDGTWRGGSVPIRVSGPFERFIGIDWSGAAKTSGQRVYVAEAHLHDALDAAAAIGAARSCYRLPSPGAVPEEARRREGWIAGVQIPG